jgi:outer membrane protein insertion porin family
MRGVGRASALPELAASAALALAVGLAALGPTTPASAAPSDPPAASGALPDVEISRVEVTGVVSFMQSEIEEMFEISSGDRLERVKVIRTAENLEEFYRSRGYEQASVRTRLSRQKGEQGRFQYILDFVVTEGKPTRVAAVRFVPERIPNDAFRKYWRSLELDLESRTGLSPGDVYDQDKVAAGKRAVQELLASEEFVGARVDDIRVSSAEPPLLAGIEKAKDAGRWVALEFHIDLGDRVSFGFRGNTIFTQSKMSALVEEQRVVGFGKDYVGAIRARIEDEYKGVGFADVKVTPYTTEKPARHERRVTFHIVEGPRVTLEEVAFDGNLVFSSDELRSEFMRRAPVLVQNGYYVEKDVQKALDFMIEWMKSNGYLASKVLTITRLPSARPKRAGQKSSSVRLMVYVYEGDQTLVQSVKLEGLTAFSEDEVKAMLGLREAQPLNLFAFNEGLHALKASYRAKGYLEARIANEGTDKVVLYRDENRQASIMLQLEEGRQFKTGAIEIEGLSSTQEIVVRRELAFKEGEVLSETAVLETEARLRRLGIFSRVTIHLDDDPTRPDAKRVVISLTEGTPGVLAGGPGFRNDFGARLFGQLAYTNLWGLNHTVSLSANVNRRIQDYHFVEYMAQLAYIYPWFLGHDLTFRPSLTATGTEYIESFDATVLNIALTWEKKLVRSPFALTAIFTYSLEQVHEFNFRFGDDSRRLRIGSVIPGLRLDTRDNPLSPTRGWYASADFEYASPLLFSQTDPYPIGYSRFQGRLDRFVSLPFGISWYLSFRTGYEVSRERRIPLVEDPDPQNPAHFVPSSGTIPFIKQFALGGSGSLRGYTEQELNAYSSILGLSGSLSYVNYRTQIDFPLAGPLRVGPFLDAANLLVDNTSARDYFLKNMQFGAGFGFHYSTPVGSVNLDVGFKLSSPAPTTDPLRNRGSTNFYFSIGMI